MADKPTVIFIHGMWSRAWMWENWQRIFRAAGYPYQAVTLPGHEAEPDEPPPATLRGLGINDYVDTVLATVRKCPEPPILIGHSMGGLIAQMVAAKVGAGVGVRVGDQTRVAAVVGVNSAAPGAVFPLRSVTLPGTLRHFANPLLYFSAFRLNPWEATYLLFNEFDALTAQKMTEKVVHESGRVAWQIGFGPLNLFGSNRVSKSKIKAPMLFVAGELDRIVPVGTSRATAAWYGAQATYREYPDHAHWLLGEPGFEVAVKDVLAWLGSALDSAPVAAPD